MNTLQTTINDRMNQTGYHQEKEFFSSDSIVFTKNGKNYLHTFNYLNLQFPSESYLEFNDPCIQFNDHFGHKNESNVTQEQKQRLSSNGFLEVINHQFSNQDLEMDFYPAIKGHYIKDKDNNHYMLLSIQKYNSEDFTGLKLLKYTQPHFTFPHQDNYIKN